MGNSVNVEMPLLLPFFLVLPFCLSNPVSSEHSGLKGNVKDDLEETLYKSENLDDIEELIRKLETKNVNAEILQKQLKEMSNANSSSSSCPSGWWAGPAGLGCVLLQTEELTWE